LRTAALAPVRRGGFGILTTNRYPVDNMIQSASKLLAAVFMFLALPGTCCGEEYGTIIFYGYLKHVVSDPRNHEGNMDLLGFSKEINVARFGFDTGANSYVDSYRKRSYAIFSNISHEDYHFGILTPMLEVGITSKGKDYDKPGRQTYPFLIPKLRLGARDGLFVDLSGLPKVGSITNGWLALELGYKW
jgi:hypothetical protein